MTVTKAPLRGRIISNLGSAASMVAEAARHGTILHQCLLGKELKLQLGIGSSNLVIWGRTFPALGKDFCHRTRRLCKGDFRSNFVSQTAVLRF